MPNQNHKNLIIFQGGIKIIPVGFQTKYTCILFPSGPTRAFCDGSTSVNKTPICGFPTGSSFDYTGRLFSCDITTGVTVVGPFGGLAKALLFLLKTECLSFSFLAWMLLEYQNLYFSDASGVFNFT